MTCPFDVIVIGAGAAGLMCAIEAGKRGRRVALLERADRIGKKILISGGGRCNFTNLHCEAENFISSNPHFCKSALARYQPADFIGLLDKHNVRYHEKTLGQLFCDHSAQDIVDVLEKECAIAGVKIFTGMAIEEVHRGVEFHIRAGDAEFLATALVVATGGLSIPKIGATPFGYDLARQFGLAIRECRPGLVPITLGSEDRQRYCDLTGMATEVIASLGTQKFREKMLITHRGLSGPAILQISSYWKGPLPITLDLAPDREWTKPLHEARRRDTTSARSALRTVVPQRFADRWLDLHLPGDWTNHSIDLLEESSHRWTIQPSGTEGYEKAEVTVGGVDTDELSSKTMESRKVPGLFFIGEVADVTGQLGGFNFQWAWASGYCAGQAV